MNTQKLNHYDIIGRMSRDAKPEDIKKAYKELAKHYHPDKNQHNEAWAKEKMAELNEAYEILSNPKKRAAYKEMLHAEDERIKHDEDNKRKKEAEEKLKKQREAENAKRAKNSSKAENSKQKNPLTETNDSGSLVGAVLGLAALVVVIAALSKKK